MNAFKEMMAECRKSTAHNLLKALQLRCECWYIPYLPKPMRKEEYLYRKAMLTVLLEKLEEEYAKGEK